MRNAWGLLGYPSNSMPIEPSRRGESGPGGSEAGSALFCFSVFQIESEDRSPTPSLGQQHRSMSLDAGRSGVVGGTRNASSDVLCPHKLTPVHRRSLRGTHWCLSAPHTTVDDGLGAGSMPGTFCIGRSSTHHHRRVSYRRDGGHRDIRRADRVSVLVRAAVPWCPVP